MIQTVTIFLTLLTDCLFIRLRSRFRLSILFCDILLRSVVLIEYNVSHIYIHSNSTLSSIRTVSNTCRFHSVRYACTRGTYATERTLGEDINLLNGGSRRIILDDRDNRTNERKKHKYYLQQTF